MLLLIFQHFDHQPNGPDHILVIVYDPDFSHSKCALTLSASAGLIPGTALNSNTVAFLIISTEPKCFKRALRLAGPIPGMESNAEAMPSLVRRARWAVMAKRCASSRIRCTRYSPCECRGRSNESGLFGKNISSSCLA